MSEFYDQEVRDAIREVQVRFETTAREKARQALQEALELSSEVLTSREIWAEVHYALGLDERNED